MNIRGYYKKWLTSSVVLFVIVSSQAQQLPKTFLWDPQELQSIRLAIASRKFPSLEAIQALESAASKALRTKIVSVVDKEQFPPSGDKHDYLSLARYWWPNPATKNGLPYVRRDGEVNPEIYTINDHKNLSTMIRTVKILAIAYYYTGNEVYAQRAAQWIKAWFIEDSTRMNPHLRYAQVVLGRNEGRGAGIIDAHLFCEFVDACGFLQDSKALSADEWRKVHVWFSQYLKWLLESEHGKKEAEAKNNHGSWYDVQVVSISFFLGDTNRASIVLSQVGEKRISKQIEIDGSQPYELERTRSFGYSLFNLKALFYLALLGERIKIDLWNYTSSDGRSLRKALDYLLPYITSEKQWEKKQITDVSFDGWEYLLFKAARVYKDQRYAYAAQHHLSKQQSIPAVSLLLNIEDDTVPH